MAKPEAKRDIDQEFNLNPDPRVLPMLGEINLEQWRCIAELIDNSVDGFLHAARAGQKIDNPKVDVDLPVADVDGAMVTIRDNGPGMTPEVLQSAVSAGWSGNNPIDNLGLFGMGFNIATARLGSLTEVWTSRKGDPEEHGLEIDFDKLRKQGHFRTAHLRRAKADPDKHGTEIRIKRLKPEQRRWLVKGPNQTNVRRRLSQTYSSMLRTNGIPLSFNLFVNTKRIPARNHCVWDQSRTVTYPDIGTVSAVIDLDYKLADRPFCTNCMSWLSTEIIPKQICPLCEAKDGITNRKRHVKGWIGIQRYLDKTEFGIDFLRNGRKVEISNKDLFVWKDAEGEEPEYPIDDQRGRGRIVGEIHIDHCRVSYSKDRFDRADPSWEEMVHLIRGEGPLRPEKARSLGYNDQDKPLFKLFKAFRRTSPHSKVAGAWKKIMIVKDNERAAEMATSYHDGDPAYQDDSKWWDLIEEAERELLYGDEGKKPGEDEDGSGEAGGDDLPEGLLDDGPEDGEEPGEEAVTPQPLVRQKVASLSRLYVHRSSSVQWAVTAYEVEQGDPELSASDPWKVFLSDTATRTYTFLFNRKHEVFRSITMTPLDALLIELSFMTAEYLRSSKTTPNISQIIAELRGDYAAETILSAKNIVNEASEVLNDIMSSFVDNCDETSRANLFNELSVNDQQTVMRSLATRKIKPNDVIRDGSFFKYAPRDFLLGILNKYPEFFFDGKVWDVAYSTLDYNNVEITNTARDSVRDKYLSLIRDAIWIANRDTSDFNNIPRDELVRALMSLRLIRPDVEVDE